MEVLVRQMFLICFLILSSQCPVFSNDAGLRAPKINAKKHVLDNGLTVLMVDKPDLKRVACMVVYNVGSIDERPGSTGLAHFFEHMMFKGTSTIGVKKGMLDRDRQYRRKLDVLFEEMATLNSDLDESQMTDLRRRIKAVSENQRSECLVKDEIFDIYKSVGGNMINAFTHYEKTVYMVNVPKESLETFFWIESDRMHNIELREFHSEKEVVRNERRANYESKPRTKAYFEFMRVLFAGTPYSWPTLGWTEDLERVTRQQAMDFYHEHYCPSNATIILVGAVQPDQVEKLSEKYFGGSKKQSKNTIGIVDVSPELASVKRVTVKIPSENELVLGFRLPEHRTKKTISAKLLARLLNQKSCEIYRILVEEKKIFSSLEFDVNDNANCGAMFVNATLANGENHDDAEKELVDHLSRLDVKRWNPKDLEGIKKSNLVDLYGYLKYDFEIGLFLSEFELSGGWEQYETYINDTLSQTMDDLADLSDDLFDFDDCLIGHIVDSREGGEK